MKFILAFFILAIQIPFNLYSQRPSRPNIVFIISDDHRWDALGVAGNTKIKTPVLDKLANEGVYFRQATIHVAQCAPTRAMLLTGLAPHQNGYYSNNFIRQDLQWVDSFPVPTMPELLRAAGYQTVLVGKWHLPVEPWMAGFTEIRTWLPEGASNYVDARLANGSSRKKELRKGFTNGFFADDAVDFLNSPAAKEKPFFLWFASTLPHGPRQPNPEHIEDIYKKDSSDLRPPGFPKNGEIKLGESADNIKKDSFHEYYQAVSYLDELVGKILSTLNKQGLADNTIVVFLGDNGFMAGSRGLRGKVVPWEESVRVPMIIRAPKLAKIKGTSNLPVSSLDVPATILKLAGVSYPQNWPGRNLLPVLMGDKNHGIEYAISEWADTESQFRNYTYRSIRTPKYKLIRWAKSSKPDELYDLIVDPHETNNIIDLPRAHAIRDKMKAQLMAWMKKTNDPALNWTKNKTNEEEETKIEEDMRLGLDDKTPAPIDPNILMAYVGRYEFATMGTAIVSTENGKLFYSMDASKNELIPKSDTSFLHKTLPARFTFVKDKNGKVTHFILRNNLGPDLKPIDMIARRME